MVIYRAASRTRPTTGVAQAVRLRRRSEPSTSRGDDNGRQGASCQHRQMALSCLTCGGYGPEQPREDELACPACGHPSGVPRRPVLVVTGAAGSGKSTICAGLAGQKGILALDGDVLASGAWAVAEGHRDYEAFWKYLLDVAREVHHNDLVPVYCCICLPEQVLDGADLTRFAAVHFLALVCDAADLEDRILSRHGGQASAANLDFHLDFNSRLRHASVTAPNSMRLLTTSGMSVAETVKEASSWAATSLGTLEL